MRITAITCVKNEGPFLIEWIAFNRVIGCTDFLFYSNDCDDGTDIILDTLADHGIVQHLPNPAEGRNYQMEALKDAKKQAVVDQADWWWIADVDEFLNIHVGDHTIPSLIEACWDRQAISLNFQFFANAGVEAFEDRPVISQFIYSHNPDIWCGEFAIEVKSLVRRDFPLQYFGAHRPFFKSKLAPKDRPSWSDGSGRDVPHQFLVAANPRRMRKFPAPGSRDFATLNHYALRSLDSYLVKNDRGDVNRENRDFDDTYWRERNDMAFEDRSILRYLPALEAEMAALKSLPGIAELHEQACELHRAKRDRLLAQPDYISMRDQLKRAGTMCPKEEDLVKSLGIAPLPSPYARVTR
ncbi:glycosyltransferase family 2 protein [Pseudooceanicola sp. MF1-13]|uniref:glycosyltransferase family 2 protein n=1 Tax=Pseudooceanicola sp. MF1-13 TaxID=3379095 RepID=UPI0038924837